MSKEEEQINSSFTDNSVGSDDLKLNLAGVLAAVFNFRQVSLLAAEEHEQISNKKLAEKKL